LVAVCEISLAGVDEKFLQLVGRFLDWLMNRKTKSASAGRPTIENPWLIANRDRLVDMLSCWWGEVGWQLTRATTREELRAAFEPLNEHPNRHHISRLLLPSSDSATPEEIREERQTNGIAIAAIYEPQKKLQECMAWVGNAEMALGQALPEQMEAVKTQLSKFQGDLQTAKETYEAACREQQAIEKRLDQMEAGFAQDQLLMFIDKRFINGKYARNPRNLADAMAGLPFTHDVHFMGAWQSYARCSKLRCSLWQHHRFQVFETIQSIWKKSQTSKLPLEEFFHQEIMAMQEKVVRKTVDPVTQEEERNRVENGVRSYLLDNWPIWSRAIRKSLETPVESERMAFVITSNFTKVQREPQTKTLVDLVLGRSGKD
jgi:hypothetical protein